MIDPALIKENANVMGADGVHIGTVDRVGAERIRLTMANDPGIHHHHNHFIALTLAAGASPSHDFGQSPGHQKESYGERSREDADRIEASGFA
jgi:hypothetical protein